MKLQKISLARVLLLNLWLSSFVEAGDLRAVAAAYKAKENDIIVEEPEASLLPQQRQALQSLAEKSRSQRTIDTRLLDRRLLETFPEASQQMRPEVVTKQARKASEEERALRAAAAKAKAYEAHQMDAHAAKVREDQARKASEEERALRAAAAKAKAYEAHQMDARAAKVREDQARKASEEERALRAAAAKAKAYEAHQMDARASKAREDQARKASEEERALRDGRDPASQAQERSGAAAEQSKKRGNRRGVEVRAAKRTQDRIQRYKQER
jgi:colicin import membrane protein